MSMAQLTQLTQLTVSNNIQHSLDWVVAAQELLNSVSKVFSRDLRNSIWTVWFPQFTFTREAFVLQFLDIFMYPEHPEATSLFSFEGRNNI